MPPASTRSGVGDAFRGRATVGSRARNSLQRASPAGALAVHALRGADLDVLPSGAVVLLGPSGSGKSTLPVIDLARSAWLGGMQVGDQIEIDLLDDRRRTVMLPVAALVED